MQARQAQLSISGLWSQTAHGGVNNGEPGEHLQQQQHQRQGVKEGNGGDGDLVGVSRNNDIALLQSLNVRYICDLMVEDRKIKYGMVLTSSEKVDKHSRYHSWFDLVTIPCVAPFAFYATQTCLYSAECCANFHLISHVHNCSLFCCCTTRAPSQPDVHTLAL